MPALGTQWGPGGHAPAALERHCDPCDRYSWVGLQLVDCFAVDIAADIVAVAGTAAAVVDIVAEELVDTAVVVVAVDTAAAAVPVVVADIVDIVAEAAPAVVGFAVLVVVVVVAPGLASLAVVEAGAAVAAAAVAQPTAENIGRCH